MSDSLENDTAVEENANPSVARSTALMSIATLFSRATGLIRTWAMAFALGNSLITSSYQVANNMPNVIYELVAGGLLAAAFLPVYMLEKERGGEKSGNEFANNLLNITIVVLGILSILATIFAPQVIATQTFTVSEDAEVYQRAVAFFRIFAMQIVFYGIGGIVTGLLNANRVFFLPSMAPAVNNVIVTAAFFAYIPLSSINFELAIMVLAIGTTVGVAAQFLIQIPALIKLGFKYRPHINLKDPALVEALKIAAPTLLYIVGTMVAFSCRNAFSLQAGENGPSTLLYAWTWYQLPYGVIAVSLSRALFTEMGEAVAKEDWPNMRSLVHTGYSATLLLIIPLAAIMVSVSVPIMELFQVGAFSGDDVVYVARILSVWLISLPFYAIVMLLYNIYASMRKFFRFALVSTAMVVVQCALYYVLSSPACGCAHRRHRVLRGLLPHLDVHVAQTDRLVRAGQDPMDGCACRHRFGRCGCGVARVGRHPPRRHRHDRRHHPHRRLRWCGTCCGVRPVHRDEGPVHELRDRSGRQSRTQTEALLASMRHTPR